MKRLNRRELLWNSLSMGATALVGGQLAKGAAARGGSLSAPIAETQYGKVRGVDWGGVQVFRGVPYGGTTEGSARFLPPSRPSPWAGIREATENGPRCAQGSANVFLNPTIGEYFRGSTGRTELAAEKNSENCLVLNVLTPGLKGKRPVMIYIHGGGYSNLSSQIVVFGDALPREEDVVLVGFNHRLSAFGYMYLGGLSEKYAVGNVGQLDLVMALEWVRDNIAQFGGDPGNVTLFGVSGGGGKLNTLMAMRAAKGLFHRAIIESGSLLRADDKDTATQSAKAVLQRLGLSENQVDELQKVPADKLYAAAEAPGAREPAPVVDGHTVPQQIWDPTAPAISADIPLIIGCCQDEATLFSTQDEALFHLDEAGLRDGVVKAGIPASNVDPLLAAYHHDYPQDTPSDIYFRISTDRGARWNATRQAELQIAQGKAKVYLYCFAWAPPLAGGKFKAFHTAEHPLSLRIVRYPESEQLSKQISGAWVAFARHGSPQRPGLPDWPAYSTAQRATMIFDVGKSEAVNDPNPTSTASDGFSPVLGRKGFVFSDWYPHGQNSDEYM
jgi:para-nitrobenzyl esterase